MIIRNLLLLPHLNLSLKTGQHNVVNVHLPILTVAKESKDNQECYYGFLIFYIDPCNDTHWSVQWKIQFREWY